MPKGGEAWTVGKLLTTVALSAFVPTVAGLVSFGLWLSSLSSTITTTLEFHWKEIGAVKAESFTKDAAAREFRRIDERSVALDSQLSEVRHALDDSRRFRGLPVVSAPASDSSHPARNPIDSLERDLRRRSLSPQ